jgi:hypothetical protein
VEYPPSSTGDGEQLDELLNQLKTTLPLTA